MRLTEAEAVTLKTYDDQAEGWSSSHTDPGFWDTEIAVFHKYLPRGKIIEIGAGGGRDAKQLVKLGYEYIGTDISGGLIKVARKENPGVKFIKQSVYKLDYENEFDGFWCSAVLLHIPRSRLKAALQSIRRTLKKGAIGFISMKEGTSEKLEKDEFGERLFIYWQDKDFTKALKENGFSVIDKTSGPDGPDTKWLTYIVKKD